MPVPLLGSQVAQQGQLGIELCLHGEAVIVVVGWLAGGEPHKLI